MPNKYYQEIKSGILYCANQLGEEVNINRIFQALEKIVDLNNLSEPEIKTHCFKMSYQLGCHQEFISVLQSYNQLPKRRKTEQETRETIFRSAKRLGIPKEDVQKIFNKYDMALKNCTSELERQQISEMGAAEIHMLLGVRGALVVNNKEIIPKQEDFVEQDDYKFTKL